MEAFASAWGSTPVDAGVSPAKRHSLALSVDGAGSRRASLVDMDHVRLLKSEPADFDAGAQDRAFRELRATHSDDVLLEQLLVDDPLVATLAAAQEFTTSSEEESHSDTGAASETKVRPDASPGDQDTAKKKAALLAAQQAAAAALAGSIPEDEIGLSPLEIRRKRNRESMQRARARQRNDIDSMKVVMRQLEAHFQRLSEQKEQQRIDAAALTPAGQARRPMDQVETEYRQLADASRRLKEEKFLLEKMLTEKTKTFRRLQQAMVDRKVELGINTPLTPSEEEESSGGLRTGGLPAGLSVDFFSPITEQQADDAIKRCYDDIVRLEKMSKPLRNSASPQGRVEPVLPPSSTFGWAVLCHMLPADSGFFVAFTKTFMHETPDEVMLKTWTLFSRPENNAGAEKKNGVLRMDTLQVVNENAYVAYRDAQHPSGPTKTLRTVFLRFRLQTEHGGYVIGRACMNPTNPELRALDEREGGIVYGDYSSWIEFRTPSDGSPGCEVKFGAILAYNTQEDMQLRLINALTTTIMWETTVIRPLFSLQSSLEE